ncbi:hypothetical protein SAMN05444716_1291, partial [Streptomyces harbinensis]
REAEGLRAEAGAVVEAARDDADRLLRDATTEAERVRRAAARDADTLRAEAEAEAGTAREEAARARRDAERDTTGARARAAAAEAEATRLREEAAAERAQAAQLREEAEALMDRATSRGQRRLAKAKVRTERREVLRAARVAARGRRREQRAARAARIAGRVGQFTRNNARRVLVAVPILAPMAVAWWSQMDYARTAFGWYTVFAIGFAGAWELTTAFTGWMYHQAKKIGDGGLIYRVFTWIFAAAAAAMNYAHHCGPEFSPTQPAVAFATMSIVGMILWELYASLLHREESRRKGRTAQVRPRIGLIRWMRYPATAWAAWSLTITDESLRTVGAAWAAAGEHRAQAREARERAGLRGVRLLAARVAGTAGWAPLRSLPPVTAGSMVVPVAGVTSPYDVPVYAVERQPVPQTTTTRTGRPVLPQAVAEDSPEPAPALWEGGTVETGTERRSREDAEEAAQRTETAAAVAEVVRDLLERGEPVNGHVVARDERVTVGVRSCQRHLRQLVATGVIPAEAVSR